ncbi:DUF1178 family protein [Azospirillaceae bacterium]
MIRYHLNCGACDCEFDEWFDNMAAYDDRRKNETLVCPQCGSREVRKAIMAPNVGRAPVSPPSSCGGPNACAGCPMSGMGH